MASANAGVELSASGLSDAARSSVTIGVVVCVVVGKTVGITVFSLAAAKLGVAQFPVGMGTRQLVGLSMLAGIGFTVSLFITGLAGFDDPSLVDQAKIGILAASAVAAGGGLLILSRAADPARDSRHDLPSSLPE
jgi:NhaA family Na+:H+ antiporter